MILQNVGQTPIRWVETQAGFPHVLCLANQRFDSFIISILAFSFVDAHKLSRTDAHIKKMVTYLSLTLIRFIGCSEQHHPSHYHIAVLASTQVDRHAQHLHHGFLSEYYCLLARRRPCLGLQWSGCRIFAVTKKKKKINGTQHQEYQIQDCAARGGSSSRR